MTLTLTNSRFAFLVVCLCTLSITATLPASAEEPITQTKPNIVVFLADDLGWNDVGYHGSEIRTPKLDSLAASGVQLKQFYVQSLCTPTRAAFLTGRYPFRYRIGTITPSSQKGLSTAERTLAEALKAQGYETAIVGKWHLGHNNRKFLPLQRGFDHQYGCYGGAVDYITHMRGSTLDWHRNEKKLVTEGYATTLLANEASDLIEAHDTTIPLFLYLAFTAAHLPLQAPREYIKKYKTMPGVPRRIYAAMVTCMDDAIGQVMASLEKKGMRENTLVIFSSDNGGAINCGADNSPYRGSKGEDYEGAVRVPAFFNWPGHLKPAQVQAPLHIVDFYPTLLTLAGGSLEQPLALDGVDIWKTLTLEEPSPHEEIVLYMSQTRSAIRRGDWKIMKNNKKVELFNLADDPVEANDLGRNKAFRSNRMELLKRVAEY
ncbi:MAG: arylsulfatase B, partial [Planctomycetota bacterium]